ncbi:hypothetical protein ACFOWE_32495 [Planomonospora corallina]|uniref:Uncharacterized protein n=1 Tax=Planomonospora corallina TaxID=1806052 RepID=A0ABV8IJ56_9ACTN
MVFSTNTLRRAAVGVGLVLTALAFPATAQAATAQTATPAVTATEARLVGPFTTYYWCSLYTGGKYGSCVYVNGRWYARVP